MEHTLSILKPDVTRRNLTGAVNAAIEAAGFRIVAQKKIHLTEKQAQKFYEVHKDRPFYAELVASMITDPVVVQVLAHDNGVLAYRELVGETNPSNAKEGTLRKKFALSIGENSVHGSDSVENAKIEIAFFFSGLEILV